MWTKSGFRTSTLFRNYVSETRQFLHRTPTEKVHLWVRLKMKFLPKNVLFIGQMMKHQFVGVPNSETKPYVAVKKRFSEFPVESLKPIQWCKQLKDGRLLEAVTYSMRVFGRGHVPTHRWTFHRLLTSKTQFTWQPKVFQWLPNCGCFFFGFGIWDLFFIGEFQ